MKLISRLLMTIGVIGVLVCIFILIGCILFSLTPPLKDQIQTISVSAEAVKNYDKKLAAFKLEAEKCATTKEIKEVSFTITEEELNSKLIEVLAEGELPFKEVLVNFRGDKIWVYTVVTSTNIPAKIGIKGTMSIVKNTMHANVDEFELGKLPLPASATEKIGELVNALIKIESPFDYLPIKIVGITVADNKLTIRGLTIAQN